MTNGINRHHWENARMAALRIQRRRDEIETEQLLDDLHIHGEEERAGVTGARCSSCGAMLLVDGHYCPYAPSGRLVCAACLEDSAGWCCGPGAIVRD